MVEGDRLRYIPIGVEDFKKIREGNYYFVDKSELISDILSDGSEVFLFTRPRRFGKSLNLSMIDAFFNMEYKGNTWFDGLRISEHDEVVKHRNAYPVIHINMKDSLESSYDTFMSRMASKISDLFQDIDVDADRITPERFDIYKRGRAKLLDRDELGQSVRILCKILNDCHGVPPIILIDEYDNPINNSFNRKDHREILDFLRDFYSSTLKGNENMSFAVVTGVMQIAKESIFSGLNNLSVNNIFSKESDERYGFTPDEVRELCAYYGHPERFEEAKEWYNGYRFGNAEIYNPWSILNYVRSKFDPEPYWAGTSGNDIIDILLDHADPETYRELQSLGEGRTVTKGFPTTITLGNMGQDKNTVYAVMAIAGYLNAVPDGEGDYSMSIPNQEMYRVFRSILLNRLDSDASRAYRNFFDGMEAADLGKMKTGLDSILYDNIPFFVLSKEKDYQLILAAAAMSRLGRYTITIEEESGDGRADIIMKPNRPGSPNIIFELKRSDSDNDAILKKHADEAIGQVLKKNYHRGMRGRTLVYGICFHSKRSAISIREMDLS